MRSLLESHLKDEFGANDQRGLEQIPRDKVNYDRHDQSNLERGGSNWVCFAAKFDISNGVHILFIV